jgi:Nickel responsive protein SCO4226-like
MICSTFNYEGFILLIIAKLIQNLDTKGLLPKFLDVHPMKGTTEETLKQIQMSPKDEFGVIHVNILFNPEADRVFCILDAPDKGAVEKNHQKLGLLVEKLIVLFITSNVIPSNEISLLQDSMVMFYVIATE